MEASARVARNPRAGLGAGGGALSPSSCITTGQALGVPAALVREHEGGGEEVWMRPLARGALRPCPSPRRV